MIALPSRIGPRALSLQSLRGEDEAVFWSLNQRWRDYVLTYFEIFNELAAAPSVKSASLEIAARHEHLGRGFSAKTIRHLWREFRRTQDWQVLLKGYLGKQPQPPAFIALVQQRCENNQRKCAAELRKIRREWSEGAAIAGYGTWQQHWQRVHPGEEVPEFFPDDFFPEGWHPRNLYRYVSSEAELGLARDGLHATHHLLPQIERTTVGLRPLEGVVFDDVRTDWLVIVPGIPQPVELWLLIAMDIATRKILTWAAKAIVTDDDGKKQHLLHSEMRLLTGSLLKQYGIPRDYVCHWVVENQTATLNQGDVATLRQISGGTIAVTFSGMTHRAALPGGYVEDSGQPWFKAVLESFFNLFHNELAALPGQTGASYAVKPGELEGRRKAAKALLKAAAEADLDADTIRRLKAPFLHHHEAIDVITHLVALLNQRCEHDLEGFETRAEFRFSPAERYQPIEQLARYPREQIRLAQIRHRRESPDERWDRLARGVAFDPVSDLAALPLLARTVERVEVFKPYHVRIGKVIYRAEHERLRCERREPFTARILDSDPTVAHLFDAGGAHVVAVRCTEKVGWFDEAAHVRAFGELNHYRALLEQPLKERHADRAVARAEAEAHNAALLAAGRTGRAMVEAADTARLDKKRQDNVTLKRNAQRARQLAARAEQQLAERTP